MKTLSLFDFDGTITRQDSLFQFLKFTSPTWKWWVGLILFILPFSLAKLGILARGGVKERFISFFLKGYSKDHLESNAKEFLEFLRNQSFFRSSAVAALAEAKKTGEVAIVTASLDIWMSEIAGHLGTELICTKGEFENGLFTGKFDGQNCNYDEKPKRVSAKYDLKAYDKIVYYGDSKGDMAMKPLVHEFHLNKFRE